MLWSWKGDYWNFKSGAETGLYRYNKKVYFKDHYDAVDFEIPMSISLYNYDKNEKKADNKFDAIFNWEPKKEQWWATGFNPTYEEIKVSKMVSVMSYDFSGLEKSYEGVYKGMYKAIKETDDEDIEPIVFDDGSKTIWFAWYKEKNK